MTIKTTQKCDKCKAKRELKPNQFLNSAIAAAARVGGWRELNGKHLCPACVREVIG